MKCTIVLKELDLGHFVASVQLLIVWKQLRSMGLKGFSEHLVNGSARDEELFFEVLFKVLLELRRISFVLLADSLGDFLGLVADSKLLALVIREWLNLLHEDLHTRAILIWTPIFVADEVYAAFVKSSQVLHKLKGRLRG